MAKTKNITPEERENAISLIKKLGLEETDERINYYVRMQRDSRKHKEQESQSDSNEIQAITPSKERKIRRLAKIGMWVIYCSVILTFVRAGFGISFWWYLFLALFLFVAFYFGGVNSPESDGKLKRLSNEDCSVVRVMCFVGGALLAILYLWGPLNPNYSSGGSHNSYNMPTEYHTEPCDKCGSVGTYYIAEDGTRTGDRRYSWGHRKYCYGCYKEMENFNNALKRSNSPYADYSH